MRLRADAGLWMALAVAAGLVVTAATFAVLGADVRGTRAALAATGRLSFLLFWAAYAGGALALLTGPASLPLQRYGRDFGLAFAAAHLVHLGLVVRLCQLGDVPPLGTFALFGLAAAWVYVLALFSFDGPRALIGPQAWRLLREAGMNFVALAFAVDFIKQPLRSDVRHVVEYTPFALLVVLGPALRVAAFVIGERRGRAPPAAYSS
jgi:hypothetical protein